MPKIDFDKLQDSLEYIKTVCENQQEEGTGCVGCPIGDKNGSCRLGICPLKWHPRHPETDVFRVLE